MDCFITVIVPVFNTQDRVSIALDSIYKGAPNLSRTKALQVIVVDDGSTNRDRLDEVLFKYKDVLCIKHQDNMGLNAARNSGIAASKGNFVTILDSDDWFVENWESVLYNAVDELPLDSNVCFVACSDQYGNITASKPNYHGYLSYIDQLNERYSGEYLPIFRGDYIRERGGYVDIGTKKSCGTVTHLGFAKEAPFWVFPEVIRIYNYSDSGNTLSSNWLSPIKAQQTVKCYQAIFLNYGEDLKKYAKKTYSTKYLRYSIYLRFAGLTGAWKALLKGISIRALPESLVMFFLMLLPENFVRNFIFFAKRNGFIRKFG